MHIGFCYECNNPLYPYIKCHKKEEREIIRKYKKINPIFLSNNDVFIKSYNLKAKRVCYSCYFNSNNNNNNKCILGLLRKRECGIIKNIYPLSKSLTKNEILLWFSKLLKYTEKNNLSNITI